MMKKIIIILALIIAALAYYYGVGAYKGEIETTVSEPVVMEKEKTATVKNEVTEQETKEDVVAEQKIQEVEIKPASVVPEDEGKITLAELAKHDNDQDCWVVYKGSVYDVTKFLPIHPGGSERIAQFCGTMDFESAFTGQHGTSKVKKLESGAGKLQGEI